MATTNVLLLWIRVDSDKEGWKTGMGRDKEGSRGKGHGVQGAGAADKSVAHKDGRGRQGHGMSGKGAAQKYGCGGQVWVQQTSMGAAWQFGKRTGG